MAQVSWTDQAVEDLAAIHQFVSRDSSSAAGMLVARIVESTRRLAQFPKSGRRVPEIDREEIREVVVQSYRVIYRLREERIEIITVHHGSRLLGDIGPDPA